MAKENSIKIKREPTVWENIFANNTLDKDLIPKMQAGVGGKGRELYLNNNKIREEKNLKNMYKELT